MTDNIHKFPTPLDRIVAEIKNDLKRQALGERAWIEGSFDLCIHLVEMRDQFKADIEFGRYCEGYGLGRKVLDHQTRAAAIAMGRDPEALRACLEATKRTSLRYIYETEFSRFTPIGKPTSRKSETPNIDIGKPSRRKAAKKTERAFAIAAEMAAENNGVPPTRGAVQEAAGVSSFTAQVAVTALNLERNAPPLVEPLDPATASPTMRDRMEAWQRAEKKRLRESLYAEIRGQVEKEFDAYLSGVNERVARAERIFASHKGVMSKKQFMAVVKCLHPDTAPDEEQKAEAFRYFNSLKDVLVKPEEPVLSGPPLPMTAAELLARKRTKR